MKRLRTDAEIQERNRQHIAKFPGITAARLEQRSGHYRKQFMSLMLSCIVKDQKHPLRFLIDESTEKWLGRTYSKEDTHPFSVQAGHVVTRASGADEYFAIEDAFSNHGVGTHVERKGKTHIRIVIDIKGVPVVYETALMWMHMKEDSKEEEKIGLDREVLVNAPYREGWAPLGYFSYNAHTLH